MLKLFDGIREVAGQVGTFTENSTVPLTFPEPKIECSVSKAPTTAKPPCPCEIVIEEVTGDVDIQLDPKGPWVPAKEGMKVPVGAKISTSTDKYGKDGKAVLWFGCNSAAGVDNNTMFELRSMECTASGMKVRVSVDPGVVHVSVTELPQYQTDFEVSAPNYMAGNCRG